ncbi:AzlC family ABC transporter permease [Pseudolysinimonas sp.]|uniref:AzlC family ABC transporter permease n=1 Tax=Pseudolysinimonas sp. TaxID=2680009 RepID=UPI00286ACD42|nr:AzlC family ABC transporter permease [Pseudolysinimonas sp.]
MITPPVPLNEDDRVRAARRAGIRAAGVIIVSYIPFGIAAGAAMGATSVDPLISILTSPTIFAGAAQIAAVQLLHVGAALGIVVLTVAVINSRHLLYSAALAPHLADWSTPQRLGAAYLLADPVYALAVARFDTPDGGGSTREKRTFYFAAGLTCWVGWAALLAIGIVAGGFIPEWVPFELAIPLTFLLLTLPLIKNSAGLVAFAVAGIVALVADPLPLGVGLMVGAVAGVVAGAVVLNVTDRNRAETVDA